MVGKPTLRNAPIVVQRRRAVRMGGVTVGDRDTLQLDMEKQSLSDIQHMLKAITIQEVEQQERMGNEASRLAVDSREGKPIANAERRTEVQFGAYITIRVLHRIKQALLEQIRSEISDRAGKWTASTRVLRAAASSTTWQWYYVEPDGKHGRRFRPGELKNMPYGSKVVLRPRVPDIEYENMLALWRELGYRRSPKIAGKGDKGVHAKGSKRSGKGFMARSIDKAKRWQAIKPYTIYITFTNKYEPAGSKFAKQGAPCIVVMARRKKRGYRRF